MGRIVFLDVDGTLIDYEGHCPDSARRAVELARAAGNRVYLCTGCSKAELGERDLPEVDGLIGANGGYVEDAGQVVLHRGLSADETRRIVDWCEARGLGLYLEANSGLYCNELFVEQAPEVMRRYAMGKGASEVEAAEASDNFVSIMQRVSGEELYRDDVNKISFILSSYQDHLDSKAEFGELEANTWGGRGEQALFGDLGPTGITKRSAVETLLAHLGATRDEAIGFGDAKIDLSMFEACGYNVAMGNGGPEIRAAADYVTGDVCENGLWDAFERLGLLE